MVVKKTLESDVETETSSQHKRQSKTKPPQTRKVEITFVDPPLPPEEIAQREARINEVLRKAALRIQQEKESSKDAQRNMNALIQPNEKAQSNARPLSKKKG
jgi:16S rRNA G966 N2-methylase RsmD